MSSLSVPGSDDIHARAGSRNEQVPNIVEKEEFEYCFVDPLEKDYECPVCGSVLKYPVLFEECSHRCCANCLPELLRTTAKCPIDGTPIDRNRQVIVDKEYQKEIEALNVNCSFYTKGCTWSGKLKDIQIHVADCKYYLLKCPKGCGMKLEKIVLKHHLQEDCDKRDIRCEFCSMRMRAEEEVHHLGTCGKFKMPCPNKCSNGKELERENMRDHLENTCTREMIKCPFWDGGCQFECRRKHMDKHIKEDPIVHLGMACDTVILHRKELEIHAKSLTKQLQQITTLERKVDALEKLYGCQMVWRIEKWAEKVHEAKLGRKATLFSPPFLTSRHGYKMALSLCPYGDGKARGKFLSIFICICSGEYDPLLLWPFGHTVTFTLIDQCQDPEARRNVSYIIQPNTIKDNKPFLGRPVGERNASFGAQRFIELDILDTYDYLRDDQLFIKCEIDSEHMMLL
ncbi:TNF receptor-associated factor 4-like [Ruditapes philippinarum]|uniref:TNF receptor-associated factor 4-like n=1 Tax=Ruditapes philippinarum TaxID=129788 RepID=UPI00295BF81B|nr:TNF receptor-associated factor 4-like [Ruditapes philippinarum]